MALVTVQVGQCGNQVGREFLSAVAAELQQQPADEPAAGWDVFFRPSAKDGPVARCIQVDMEPKVVQDNLAWAARRGLFCYDPHNSHVTSQEGSANNWAFGYSHKAPECSDAVVAMAQREAERADGVGGLLLLHSLAGGTGSGVGAFLTEAMRDAFPRTPLLNAVVWPYVGGEVVLQSYNAALCFAALQHCSDGLLVFSNDKLHRVCERSLRVERPGFGDLNGVIARDLAGLLLPSRHLLVPPADSVGGPADVPSARPPSPSVTTVKDSQQLQALVRRRSTTPAAPPPAPWRLGRGTRPLADLQRLVFAHPAYKVSTLHCTPRIPGHHVNFSFQTWPGILKELRLMALYGDADRDRAATVQGFRSVGAFTTLRGVDLHRPGAADLSLLQEPAFGPAADPTGLPHAAVSSQPFQKYNRHGCCLVNSQAVIGPAQAMLDSATEKYAVGAYLHHFQKYGVGADVFEDSFAVLQRVIDDYENLGGR
eukprot:EG_transcript_7888